MGAASSGMGTADPLLPPQPPGTNHTTAATSLIRAMHWFIFPACPEMSGGVWLEAGAAQEEEEKEESELELG